MNEAQLETSSATVRKLRMIACNNGQRPGLFGVNTMRRVMTKLAKGLALAGILYSASIMVSSKTGRPPGFAGEAAIV